MAGFAHQRRTRIEVLVNAMTKAHQAEGIVLVFGLFDIFVDIIDAADFAQHAQHGLVCTAMGGAPEARDPGGNAGKRVGAGRAGKPDG